MLTVFAWCGGEVNNFNWNSNMSNFSGWAFWLQKCTRHAVFFCVFWCPEYIFLEGVCDFKLISEMQMIVWREGMWSSQADTFETLIESCTTDSPICSVFLDPFLQDIIWSLYWPLCYCFSVHSLAFFVSYNMISCRTFSVEFHTTLQSLFHLDVVQILTEFPGNQQRRISKLMCFPYVLY